jgi:hypothetical protein
MMQKRSIWSSSRSKLSCKEEWQMKVGEFQFPWHHITGDKTRKNNIDYRHAQGTEERHNSSIMASRLKKIIRLVISAAAVLCIVTASLGILVSRHARKPVVSDVIVVLGGDDGLRVSKGTRLYLENYAPCILLTGLDSRYYRPETPDWREKKMMKSGIARNVIFVDTTSKKSWDEAANTLHAMQEHGWKRALVVSDPPHMLRLHHTWSAAFNDSPQEFVLVATSPEWWNPLLWWSDPIGFRFVLSEINKNLYYAIMYY